MITIVDYGMGNLRSVQKALEKVGYDAAVSDDAGDVERADLLVVPGVGAFDQAVRNLRENGLWEPILDHLRDDRPYLGICLGLQLLFEGSEEGRREGFGVLDGVVRRFQDVQPVPHMGWNDVEWKGPGRSFKPERVEDPCYYFVHSYYPDPVDSEHVAGVTEYGSPFCAAIRRGRCVGVQFHPEKSQFAGLALLETICGSMLPLSPSRS